MNPFIKGNRPPPSENRFFFRKIDFEIRTYIESSMCSLSDYVRFIAVWMVFGGENSGFLRAVVEV